MTCGFGTGISIVGNRSRDLSTLDLIRWEKLAVGRRVRSRRTSVEGFIDKIRQPFLRIVWENGNVSEYRKTDMGAVELLPEEKEE